MKSNSEIEYLKDLIKDFGSTKKISPVKAFELLRVRYEVLEKNIPTIVDSLVRDTPNFNRSMTVNLRIQSIDFPNIFFHYSPLFHQLLFKGILENAGVFRNISDPKGGYVGF